MSEYTSLVGMRIRDARKCAHITMRELGEKVGLAESTIQRYEAGKIKTLDTVLIKKIAKVLGAKPDTLLGWNESDDENYYIDKDAREMAQFMFENPEYKVLFDASRNVKKEDIEFVKEMMDRMRGEEPDDT